MKDTTTFMGKYTLHVAASVLALVLAGYAAYRVEDQKTKFDRTVKETLKVSEGYDQQFIDMVNRLEDELAERASFGYTGRKDPMTGTTRAVATPARIASRRAARGAADVDGADVKPMVEIDPVRLTAIIFDNTKGLYTAVVMDGDRSFSAEVGDRIAGRRITKITNDEIYMENDVERFIYNILGGNTRIQK
jgi:hypothetical protein